jgi:hypothetical protein
MNIAMELHDSRILTLTHSEDGHGEILFHASIYRSEREPGKGAQTSGWQHLRMSFTGMNIHGEIGRIGNTQTDIYDGKLLAASNDHGGFFSTQAFYEPPISLSMFLSSDGDYRDIEIRADSLQMNLEGDFIPESIWDENGNCKPFETS